MHTSMMMSTSTCTLSARRSAAFSSSQSAAHARVAPRRALLQTTVRWRSRGSCRAQASEAPGDPDEDEAQERFQDMSDVDVSWMRNSLQRQWADQEDTDLAEKLDRAITEAEEICKQHPIVEHHPGCAIAWEAVSELSVAKERKSYYRQRKKGADKAAAPRVGGVQSAAEKAAWNKGQKIVPKESMARRLMDAEKPCPVRGDCAPPSGSFLKAAKFERAFGLRSRDQFEKMFKESSEGMDKNWKKQDKPKNSDKSA